MAQQSIDRIRVATRATGDLLASLVSMVAAVVAAGLLHPLLAPLMLLVAVPQGWASIIEARMSLGSWVRMLSNHRRLAVASDDASVTVGLPPQTSICRGGANEGQHQRQRRAPPLTRGSALACGFAWSWGRHNDYRELVNLLSPMPVT